jgi:hypothetical protein
MIRRTVTLFLSGCGLLCTVLGPMPSPSLAASPSANPSTPMAECEEWNHQPQGSDSVDDMCFSQRAFRAEEELSDLKREEKKRGLRWRPLEPNGRDLSLWYYPGAPRPLWGYLSRPIDENGLQPSIGVAIRFTAHVSMREYWNSRSAVCIISLKVITHHYRPGPPSCSQTYHCKLVR